MIWSAKTGPPNDRKSHPLRVHNALTGWPVKLCTRQVANRTSFLTRQRDVTASFSFGACIVYTEFFTVNCFLEYYYLIFKKCFGSYINIVVGVHRTFVPNFHVVIRSLCLLQARNTGAVDISWPVSTAIVSAHATEKKVKVQILVSHIMIALLITPSLKNNAYSCPCLAIGSRKKT